VCCRESRLVAVNCSKLQQGDGHSVGVDTAHSRGDDTPTHDRYGVALGSRIDKIIGLFCKRAL